MSTPLTDATLAALRERECIPDHHRLSVMYDVIRWIRHDLCATYRLVDDPGLLRALNAAVASMDEVRTALMAACHLPDGDYGPGVFLARGPRPAEESVDD